MGRHTGAQQVVQQHRWVVTKHQPFIESVQHPVTLGGDVTRAHEWQEALQIPVADIGDIEGNQADHDQHDPLTRPVLPDELAGLVFEPPQPKPAAPEGTGDDVDDKGSQQEHRQTDPGRAQEAFGVTEGIAQGQRGGQGQDAHHQSRGHHDRICATLHKRRF